MILSSPLKRLVSCLPTFVVAAFSLALLLDPVRAEGPQAICSQDAGTCVAGHTYWEVSSRSLGGCPPRTAECGELPAFRVRKCVDDQWISSTIEELLAHNVATPTNRLVVYVHGNWMTYSNAICRARIVYGKLTRYTKEPLTFIAYTWPSEKRQGFARDVYAKKARTETDAFYLGQFMQNLHSDLPTGVLAFSFGGRVAGGMLHLLGGGKLEGRSLCASDALEIYRLSLYAPAFDRTALTPSGTYSLALERVEKAVNLYNSSDPVLRRFKFIERGSPIAAGFAGLMATGRITRDSGSAGKPLSDEIKIVQYDCRGIGRSHFELDYLSCSAMSVALKNVLGQ